MTSADRTDPAATLGFLRALGLPCRDQTFQVTRELESALSRGEALALLAHLTYCRNCRRFRQQVRFLREIAGAPMREGAERLPDDVARRLRERFDSRDIE